MLKKLYLDSYNGVQQNTYIISYLIDKNINIYVSSRSTCWFAYTAI